MTDVDHDLPTYTLTDTDSLTARIEACKTLTLPILKSPYSPWIFLRPGDLGDDPARALEVAIVDSFFSSVEGGRDDLVADFIARGYVSPDTTSSFDETPLLAAVRVNNLPMISTLVSLGATVDAYGTLRKMIEGCTSIIPYPYLRDNDPQPERTPLQYAAQEGRLALVKVLMEDYGANDALIAPDGALALRLAAMNGHRDVVAYLPSRRGGAWKRWQTAHQKEMKIVRKAFAKIKTFILVFVWEIPKCLFYYMPKELCKGIRDSAKWAWNGRKRFGGWCKKQVVEFPGRVKRSVTKAGKEVWDFIKEIPRIVKSIGKGIWRFLKAIPGALKMVALWIGRGLESIGKAVFDVLVKFVSLLHTIFSAIISFFRSITLTDMYNGFTYILRGIFVELPKAILRFIVAFGDMSYDVLKATLGCFGQCIWYLGVGILWLVTYIPQKLWNALKALGRSSRRGYQECMAFLNPKRI